MANDQHAYITMQGNVLSRKLHDPSGFLVMAPSGFKTYRTLKLAVAWTLKKGYVPHLVTSKVLTGQAELARVRFNEALDQAEREVVAEEAARRAAALEAQA